jgi:hypothetical protein
MSRWIANTLGLVSVCAVCLIGWAAWRVGREVGQLGELGGKISPNVFLTFSKVNQALDTVNRPCAPGPCGTLANIDKLTVKVGDLAVTSQMQVAQTGALVTATARNLDMVGQSVQQTATALSGTAQQATGTLAEGQRTLAAFQPVLGHADATVADLDAALKADAGAFNMTLGNVQTMTGAAAHILNDGQRVADDATEKYFKPTPWYRKMLPYVTTGAKISAYALPW